MAESHQKRVSGSMMDRIDIHVEVPRVDHEKLTGAARLGLSGGLDPPGASLQA
jgi:predicted ATPase with chaperone activity